MFSRAINPGLSPFWDGAPVPRIAIVDPQPAVRAGLTVLLQREPGLRPAGAAATAAEAVELAERTRPDIVLLDHRLPDGDGLRLCRRLRTLPGAPRVVLYSADPEPSLHILARVAGADGLVDKTAPPETLYDALRVVGRGGSALPPVTHAQLQEAAHRVEADDLALLAMLVDRTAPADVADALRLDRRGLAGRTERLLGRLRRRGSPAPAA